MRTRLLFQAVNTIKGFDDVSLPKVIPSHQFVFGEKPEKYMNFRGNSQFPDSRDKHGLNPSKVDNMIEGAGGILPLIVQLSNQGIRLGSKGNAFGNFLQLEPLFHETITKVPSKREF